MEDKEFSTEKAWLTHIRGFGGLVVISQKYLKTREEVLQVALNYWKRVFPAITKDDISVNEIEVILREVR